MKYFLTQNLFALINSITAAVWAVITDISFLQFHINRTFADIFTEVVLFTILSFPITKLMEFLWSKISK